MEQPVVTAPSVNSFKNRLDKHWALQELKYDWLLTGCGCTWYHHPDLQTFTINPTLSCSPGLVDIQSLKKSIWRFLLISKRFLKLLTAATSISSCERLFQRLVTRWEKKWRRQSQRHQSFTSFQECPSVTESSALLKNRFHGTDDSCFTILKTSIMSARLILLSSSDHSPSSSSLASYGNFLRWVTIRVNRRWTFSSFCLSCNSLWLTVLSASVLQRFASYHLLLSLNLGRHEFTTLLYTVHCCHMGTAI